MQYLPAGFCEKIRKPNDGFVHTVQPPLRVPWLLVASAHAVMKYDDIELERTKYNASIICSDLLDSDPLFKKLILGFVSPRFTVAIESEKFTPSQS